MAINKINPTDVENFKTTLRIAPANLMDEYQRIASGSAIYPGTRTPLGLMYCALKLNGEAGELAEHVGKAMRDDALILLESTSEFNEEAVDEDVALFSELTKTRRDLIIKEVGDCLWYLSAICRELGITLSEAAYLNLVKLADRQSRNALQGSGDTR